jgi:hypothetical protein
MALDLAAPIECGIDVRNALFELIDHAFDAVAKNTHRTAALIPGFDEPSLSAYEQVSRIFDCTSIALWLLERDLVQKPAG